MKPADLQHFDLSVPRFARHVWPKHPPALSEEQHALADDFVKHWHEVLPSKYDAIERFNHRYPLKILPDKAPFKTLEIGAGIGGHLAYEQLDNQQYYCVELRENMAKEIQRKFPSVTTLIGDCQKPLPFEQGYFDRIFAIHVFEHLTDLPAAIKEVHRLLRPEGILSIVIPCDPGFLYGLARKISAERLFKKRYKLPYQWFIRREHINSPAEIKERIGASFTIIDTTFFPLGLPSINLNLCMGITAVKK